MGPLRLPAYSQSGHYVPMATNVTPERIARWMLREVRERQALDQADAARRIGMKFGNGFLYLNKNGNRAIAPTVLKAFRELHEGTVGWDRRGRYWYLRHGASDPAPQEPLTRIARWHLQREADDRAKLAEIAARYQLPPAAGMDELLGRMDPADAETVREIMSHKVPSAEAMGFDAAQFEEFRRSFRPGDPAGG